MNKIAKLSSGLFFRSVLMIIAAFFIYASISAASEWKNVSNLTLDSLENKLKKLQKDAESILADKAKEMERYSKEFAEKYSAKYEDVVKKYEDNRKTLEKKAAGIQDSVNNIDKTVNNDINSIVNDSINAAVNIKDDVFQKTGDSPFAVYADTLKGINSTVNNFTKEANGFVDEYTNNLKKGEDMVSALCGDYKADLSKYNDDLNSASKSYSSFLEAGSGAQNSIFNSVGSLDSVVKGRLKDVDELESSFKTGMNKEIDGLKKNTDELIRSADTSLKQIKDAGIQLNEFYYQESAKIKNERSSYEAKFDELTKTAGAQAEQYQVKIDELKKQAENECKQYQDKKDGLKEGIQGRISGYQDEINKIKNNAQNEIFGYQKIIDDSKAELYAGTNVYLNEIGEERSKMEKDIDAYMRQIGDLNGSCRSQADSINEKINSLENAIQDLASDEAIDSLKKEMETNSKMLKEVLGQSRSQAEQYRNEINGSIAQYTGNIKEYEGSLNDYRAGAEKKIDAYRSKIDEVKTAAQTKTISIQSKIDDVNNTVRSRVSDIQVKIDGIQGSYSPKIAEQQNKINSIQDNLSASLQSNKNNIDALSSAFESKTNSLRDNVAAALGDISKAQKEFTQKYSETQGNIQKSVSDFQSGFSGAQSNLQSSFNAASIKINRTMDEITEKAGTASKASLASAKKIKNAEENIKGTIENASFKAEASNAYLSETVKQCGSKISGSVSGLGASLFKEQNAVKSCALALKSSAVKSAGSFSDLSDKNKASIVSSVNSYNCPANVSGQVDTCVKDAGGALKIVSDKLSSNAVFRK